MLGLLDAMLGGFATSSSVSLKEISAYTRDVAQLMSERCDDAAASNLFFFESVDVEFAAARGHNVMVHWMLSKRAVCYNQIKAALYAAADRGHDETLWILCEHLTTSNIDREYLEIAKR